MYFEIIDYLIKQKKERSIRQMVRDLPKTDEHESSIRKKCRKLTDDFNILTSREKISKPGTRFKAEYFQLNKNMKFSYLKLIANHYLDFFEIAEQYDNLSKENKRKIKFAVFYKQKRKYSF